MAWRAACRAGLWAGWSWSGRVGVWRRGVGGVFVAGVRLTAVGAGQGLGHGGGVAVQVPGGDGGQQIVPDRQAGAAQLAEPGRAGEEEDVQVCPAVPPAGDVGAGDVRERLDRAADPDDQQPIPAARSSGRSDRSWWARGSSIMISGAPDSVYTVSRQCSSDQTAGCGSAQA